MPKLPLIAGADTARTLDALFVNAPLRDYDERPRTNDYTLPVLGMAYIATYAKEVGGFNVGVLDAEAHGLGIEETARIVNAAGPGWAAMNLLAPTYEMSARIASGLVPEIALMVGGHHAKAMPDCVLADPRMSNLRALVLGEGELRVAALLEDEQRRRELPGALWRDRLLGTRAAGVADPKASAQMLGPDINALPYVSRAFLPQDPYQAAPTDTDRHLAVSRGTALLTQAARTRACLSRRDGRRCDRKGGRRNDEPALAPLTLAEIRRLLDTLRPSPARHGRRDRDRAVIWSRYRRRHQAIARRCHYARRIASHELPQHDGPSAQYTQKEAPDQPR